MDVNDNAPRFAAPLSANLTVTENLDHTFKLMRFSASDPDQGSGGDFSYALSDPSGKFALDPRTGTLTLKRGKKLDRETKVKKRILNSETEFLFLKKIK